MDEFSKRYPNKSQSGTQFRLRAHVQCHREKGNPSYRPGDHFEKSQVENLGSESYSLVVLGFCKHSAWRICCLKGGGKKNGRKKKRKGERQVKKLLLP